jgi:hypothetical protein
MASRRSMELDTDEATVADAASASSEVSALDGGADGFEAFDDPHAHAPTTADTQRERARIHHGEQTDDAPEHRQLFENQVPGDLQQELERADEAGIRSSPPEGPAFDKAINDGEGLKWAVNADGDLLVGPKFSQEHLGEIPHTALTRGAPVRAAGEAQIAGRDGDYVGLEITPHSGHYMPSEESLDIGREAFARYGITFPDD